MQKSFDFNEQMTERLATVGSIRALKQETRKMIEVTAADAEDAAAAEAAGIEMVITLPELVTSVREGSSKVFVTAAIDFPDMPLEEEDVLRVAVRSLLDGADAIATSRRPRTVKRLTEEYIPVMGHVGFVPRRATHFGGIRAVGKTAEEASAIWDEIRRVEDAGAFAIECELIAAPMLREMTKRTSMATISLGSGTDADIICSYTSDICGEGEHFPRHARTYADLNALYEQIRSEKQRALSEFRADVDSGSYPDTSESVGADSAEIDRFREMLGR